LKNNQLMVIFALALMLTIPAMALSNFVKADVSEAKVISTSWYFSPATSFLAQASGDLITVGEIQNVGSNYLARVYVQGYAYAANDTLLASTGNQVYGYNIAPQQKAPFFLDFSDDTGVTEDLGWIDVVASVNVTITYVNDSTDSIYSGLSITSSPVTGGSIYTVSGHLANTGDKAVTGDFWVTTTFYNSAGTVVSLNFTNYLTHSLTQGQSVPFTATPAQNYATLQIASYNSTVGYLPQSITTPAPTVQPTTYPTSTTHPTQKPSGEPTEFNYTNLVLILVLVVAVILVVFMFLKMKKPKKGELSVSSQESPSTVADTPVSPAPTTPESATVEKQEMPAKSTIVCGVCGTINDLDATFCKKCGNRFKS
jgi:hypothetical protein